MNENTRIEIIRGPMGSNGFRTGLWTVAVNGRQANVYASIPHACDLSEQQEMMESDVRRSLENGRLQWIEA